jgi:hypothetical protein
MKKTLWIAIVVASLMGNQSAFAEAELRYAGFNMFQLMLTDDSGSQVSYSGTYDQIQTQITTLQEKAIQLSSQVQLGDSCRITACFKKIVNATTGEELILPLSEEEITNRELEVARTAVKYQALLESAGNNYLAKATAIYAIPLSVSGSTQTIQGTPQQIAEQVQRLRGEAETLKTSVTVDPCSIETCYKTIVDLKWGLAPATTTTIPLTAEDLAQRAIDRNQAATRAEAIATAAEAGLANGPAPVYSLDVSANNSSFGTSGTREQLAATVAQLAERAASAAANASNLANNPIVERHVIVDLHWGLAPATTTVIEKEITGIERDSRIASANAEASNAAALAQAAQQALEAIP